MSNVLVNEIKIHRHTSFCGLNSCIRLVLKLISVSYTISVIVIHINELTDPEFRNAVAESRQYNSSRFA